MLNTQSFITLVVFLPLWKAFQYHSCIYPCLICLIISVLNLPRNRISGSKGPLIFQVFRYTCQITAREKQQCEREHLLVSFPLCPNWGRTLNLGLCPDPELKPANFWCTGQLSNQLSHTCQDTTIISSNIFSVPFFPLYSL